MRKEKYTLNDYYKYASIAQQIMSGWLAVDKEGRTYEAGKGSGGFDKEWDKIIAYHHWFNQDDLKELFYKLGISDEGTEWILDWDKKVEEFQEKFKKEQAQK